MLVAISIPIFTAQLEKSREAVDIANIRAAYAEVMTAALTEDKQTANGVTYSDADNSWSKEVTMKQSQDGWQTDTKDISIGDHKLDAGVLKGGKATIKVAVDTSKGTNAVTITYAAK